jgi:hypothetical protein
VVRLGGVVRGQGEEEMLGVVRRKEREREREREGEKRVGYAWGGLKKSV